MESTSIRKLIKKGPRYVGDIIPLVHELETFYTQKYGHHGALMQIKKIDGKELWKLGKKWNTRLIRKKYYSQRLRRKDVDVIVGPLLAVYLDGCTNATCLGKKIRKIGIVHADNLAPSVTIQKLNGDMVPLCFPVKTPYITIILEDDRHIQIRNGIPEEMVDTQVSILPGDNACHTYLALIGEEFMTIIKYLKDINLH